MREGQAGGGEGGGRQKILVHRKLNKISYFNIIFVEKQIILSVIRVILFKIEYDII